MNKKIQILIVLLAVIVFSIIIVKSYSQAQQTVDFSPLQFSASGDRLLFFDPSTGTVYSYSDSSGRLVATWTIEYLGEDLSR